MSLPVLVVGAGAAGFMAAIAAARAGAPVVLLEKTKQPGYKILISGKGRCNLTNAETEVSELVKHYPGGGKFLYGPFTRFGSADTVAFFEELGVRTRRDRGGRIFPESGQAEEVVAALLRACETLGVALRLEAPVVEVKVEAGRAVGVRLASGEELRGRAVIVTVGGQSFPGTGSTGDGYRLATELGHTVVDPFPALVPLRVEGTRELKDLELKHVEATVLADGKSLGSRQGELRFAHFGLTGPIILYLSRHAVAAQRQGAKVAIQLDLKPALSREQLDASLRREWEGLGKATLAMALEQRMPARLVPVFLAAAGVDGAIPVATLRREDRERLLTRFKQWRWPVVCALSREVAEVTAGGVALGEIESRTMASRKVPGLFWAGEVLDVDGYIGGYNFQAAWTTGYLAGTAAAQPSET